MKKKNRFGTETTCTRVPTPIYRSLLVGLPHQFKIGIIICVLASERILDTTCQLFFEPSFALRFTPRKRAQHFSSFVIRAKTK